MHNLRSAHYQRQSCEQRKELFGLCGLQPMTCQEVRDANTTNLNKHVYVWKNNNLPSQNSNLSNCPELRAVGTFIRFSMGTSYVNIP
jgi:hypothetical protein